MVSVHFSKSVKINYINTYSILRQAQFIQPTMVVPKKVQVTKYITIQSLKQSIFTSKDQFVMQVTLLLLEANDLFSLFIIFCCLFIQILFTNRRGRKSSNKYQFLEEYTLQIPLMSLAPTSNPYEVLLDLQLKCPVSDISLHAWQ